MLLDNSDIRLIFKICNGYLFCAHPTGCSCVCACVCVIRVCVIHVCVCARACVIRVCACYTCVCMCVLYMCVWVCARVCYTCVLHMCVWVCACSAGPGRGHSRFSQGAADPISCGTGPSLVSCIRATPHKAQTPWFGLRKASSVLGASRPEPEAPKASEALGPCLLVCPALS